MFCDVQNSHILLFISDTPDTRKCYVIEVSRTWTNLLNTEDNVYRISVGVVYGASQSSRLFSVHFIVLPSTKKKKEKVTSRQRFYFLLN